MEEVGSYIAIIATGSLMHLLEICVPTLRVEVQPEIEPQTIEGDIWKQLGPGAIDSVQSISNPKNSLLNEAKAHPWRTWTEDALKLRTGSLIGLGLGVPYAAGPMIRSVMRQVLADIAREVFGRRDPRKWGSTAPANVVGIEIPIAVAIEQHANGEHGTYGIVSWGTGLIEVTVVSVTSDAIVVRAFRESDRSSAVTVCRQLQEGSDPSFRWLVVPPAEFLIDELRQFSAAESVSLAVASRGVARYAQAQSSSAASNALPRIVRVVPRALGIVGSNRKGELYWHRLLNADEVPGDSSWKIKGFSGKSGEIATAVWAEGSCPNRWLAQSQWRDQLHWWQEPLTVLPTKSVDVESNPVNLVCKEEEGGLFLALESPSSATAGPL